MEIAEKTVTLHYRDTSIQERWFSTGLYCPQCGKHNVWVEDTGEYHLCAACGGDFEIMPCLVDVHDDYDKQRLEQLR